MDLIVQIKFGSHLYGTNTPTSDEDYKSVYIPEARDILLQRVVDSVQIGAKDKKEGQKNLPTDIDNECYSLQRYLSLLSEGQTVSIDMLFAPKPIISTHLWEYITANKDYLLTKKSAAFVGYCRTQANKYGIKGSRVAAAKNAFELFDDISQKYGNLRKVGEFFAAESKVIDEHTKIISRETPQSKTEWYFECCNRLIGFTNTLKEATNVFRKIYENYGDRARLAQQNEGIDWKALSHAVRVGQEAIELLKTHKITFPLENASHILEIKQGKVPYSVVAEEIENLLITVEKESTFSTLRDEPNYEFIDDLVYKIYLSKVKNSGL